MKLENMEMKNLRGPGLPVHSHSGGGLVQSASLRHSDPGFGFCDYCVDIAESVSAPTEYCPSLHFPSVRASVKGTLYFSNVYRHICHTNNQRTHQTLQIRKLFYPGYLCIPDQTRPDQITAQHTMVPDHITKTPVCRLNFYTVHLHDQSLIVNCPSRYDLCI